MQSNLVTAGRKHFLNQVARLFCHQGWLIDLPPLPKGCKKPPKKTKQKKIHTTPPHPKTTKTPKTTNQTDKDQVFLHLALAEKSVHKTKFSKVMIKVCVKKPFCGQ